MSGGYLRTIFGGLKQAANKLTKEKAILVGEDHLGNKYYEVIADQQRGIRGRRYVSVKGANQDNKYTGHMPDVPAEWHAWLRNRRPTPPTPEEQAVVQAQIERKREYARMQKEIERNGPAQQSKGISTNLPTSKASQPQAADQKVNFPVRKDFETVPGKRQ